MSDVDWNKFKVPELKAKCKELGLHVSGTKKALIERILSYYHVDPNQTATFHGKANSQVESLDLKKKTENVLQNPDKRKISDDIDDIEVETSQRKSKRVDDGSRREIAPSASDGLIDDYSARERMKTQISTQKSVSLVTDDSNISEIQKLDGKAKLVVNDPPVIRNIETSVSTSEEAQRNVSEMLTSPTQNNASEFSKSSPKKALQDAFNTDSNLNQPVLSKVSRKSHSSNANANKKTLQDALNTDSNLNQSASSKSKVSRPPHSSNANTNKKTLQDAFNTDSNLNQSASSKSKVSRPPHSSNANTNKKTLQDAFNTDSNLNQSASSKSKVSRPPHSSNANTNKNTLLNHSSVFKETTDAGKPKRKKIHHIIRKQEHIKNCTTKLSNTIDLISNQIQPVLFPLIQIPQDDLQITEVLTSCLEQTDFQTVLAAERVCHLWKRAALLAWRGLCKRNFNGILLNNALCQYPNPSNSFKDYYKRRLEIHRYNITLLSRSWIGQLYENLGHSPKFIINNNEFIYGIHQNLYSSNDHPYQLFITLRFCVARFYYYTQCGGYTGLLEDIPCILDVNEIIEEIWKIRLVNGDELVIIGATGEVIGHDFDNIHNNDNTEEPSRINTEESSRIGWWSTLDNWIDTDTELHDDQVRKAQLRVDWATYIRSKPQFTSNNNKESILPSTIDNSPIFLINKVITENVNYPNSIHKSITFESNPLEYIYSARYVLSSVEPFTVSGTLQPKPHWKVARILAFKHSLLESVESIKLPGEKVFGKKLNENICFIQTPSRGVFVLKVTGQIIGNEDDGINFMWQMLLGCGYYGEVIIDTEDNKSFQNARLEYFKDQLID
ncbi:19281_t:CDS:2 [Dentiscutata erythropus]|uniref:19281_t:CDS:1 n=1 Tax=Dentiscutata erythropus TaxID=1348616 RepID=A0A9N9BP45_9GLOM|nr:19281_t:CDS:2 [Dentiscutata erythropus]